MRCAVVMFQVRDNSAAKNKFQVRADRAPFFAKPVYAISFFFDMFDKPVDN